MAKFVGTISKLTGVVLARAEDGSTRELKLGDDVFEGEVLVTGDEALVEVMFQNAPPIVVPGNRELLLSGEVTVDRRNTITDAVLAGETPQLLATAEDGEIDFNLLLEEEATAAGAGGEGSSFVRLGRIGFGPEPLEPSVAGAPTGDAAGDSSAFDNDLALLDDDDHEDPLDPEEPPIVVDVPNSKTKKLPMVYRIQCNMHCILYMFRSFHMLCGMQYVVYIVIVFRTLIYHIQYTI